MKFFNKLMSKIWPSQFREKILLFFGAGTSVEYGVTAAQGSTESIQQALLTSLPVEDSRELQLAPNIIQTNENQRQIYDLIINNLRSHLQSPSDVNFENIYQAIQDLYVLSYDFSPQAYNEFRPIIKVTGTAKEEFQNISDLRFSTLSLRDNYRRCILQHFYELSSNAGSMANLKTMFERLQREYTLLSFTLNYGIIGDSSLFT